MSKYDIEVKAVEMLRSVFDPEIPVNVYDLGLIYKVEVSEAGASHVENAGNAGNVGNCLAEGRIQDLQGEENSRIYARTPDGGDTLHEESEGSGANANANAKSYIIDVDMTLTAPNCPAADFIMMDIKEKLESIPEVETANINLVFEPEWDKDMMSEEAKLDLGLL